MLRYPSEGNARLVAIAGSSSKIQLFPSTTCAPYARDVCTEAHSGALVNKKRATIPLLTQVPEHIGSSADALYSKKIDLFAVIIYN